MARKIKNRKKKIKKKKKYEGKFQEEEKYQNGGKLGYDWLLWSEGLVARPKHVTQYKIL